MADAYDIDDRMDFGRSREADVLGLPYDVYRVGENSNGDFIQDANRIAQNVNAYFKPSAKEIREHLEAEKLPGVIYYKVSVELSQLFKVGDVFVCADATLSRGHVKVDYETLDIDAFIITQHRAAKMVVGVRVNRKCRVFRQPEGPQNKTWRSGINQGDPLVLRDGKYIFDKRNQSGDLVPIGISAIGRPYGDRAMDGVPSMVRKSGYVAYVPPLPGFHFREGDRIKTEDEAGYTISVPFGQEVGSVGNQLFLERELAQEIS